MNKQELTPEQYVSLSGLTAHLLSITEKVLNNKSYDLQADLLALSCVAESISKKSTQVVNQIVGSPTAPPSDPPPRNIYREVMGTNHLDLDA